MLIEDANADLRALGESLFELVSQLGGGRPTPSADWYRIEIPAAPALYFRFIGNRARRYPKNSVLIATQWREEFASIHGVSKGNNWYGTQSSADIVARPGRPNEVERKSRSKLRSSAASVGVMRSQYRPASLRISPQRNSLEGVRAATAEAFTATNDASALAALMRLKGVALRTASAILHWMRPERFPILDVRVVVALGLTESASYEDFEFYSLVATRVRDLARECDVDLRTMDRALWAWDKLRSRRS